MKIQRDLIEYHGINTCSIKNKTTTFNQFNIEQEFYIPNQKPNIEQVTRMWAKGDIVDYEIVKTPIGTSMEGQTVTGYKILVCGDLKLKVEYVACEVSQSVHTAHVTYPFCAYAVLPANLNINARVKPNIIIEDIFAEQMDGRCIYNNITMMLFVDIC